MKKRVALFLVMLLMLTLSLPMTDLCSYAADGSGATPAVTSDAGAESGVLTPEAGAAESAGVEDAKTPGAAGEQFGSDSGTTGNDAAGSGTTDNDATATGSDASASAPSEIVDPATGTKENENHPAIIEANATTTSKVESMQTVSLYSATTGATVSEQDIKGIDVSGWQGDIDWNKVKAAGIQFAIIRVGGTFAKQAFTPYNDLHALQNLKDAKAAGLKIGAYHYSQALTVEEARAEANYSINLLKSYGITEMDLPFFMDYEYYTDSGGYGRLKPAYTDLTANAIAFCDTAKAAGFKAGVYADKSFLESRLRSGQGLTEAGYYVWLAHWTNSTSYAGEFQFWQYSATGKVNGISGDVDMNILHGYDWNEGSSGSNGEGSGSGDTNQPQTPAAPSVNYQVYTRTMGWLSKVKDGSGAGVIGKALPFDGIRVTLDAPGYPDSKIEYSSHNANVGWESSWKSQGASSGQAGNNRQTEAIRLRLTGSIANDYDIYYSVHVQNLGWLPWKKNGAKAGTESYGLRAEAIKIQLVKKGSPAPANPNPDRIGFYGKVTVSTQAHVQNLGWMKAVTGPQIAGTTGKGYRVEALKSTLENGSGLSGTLLSRAHMQNYGWLSWVSSGGQAGITGKSLRMEAFEMYLSGNLSKYYDVYYCSHVQNIGWTNWVKNGALTGTTGRSLRMEALAIRVVPKGIGAPAKL